MARRQIVLKVMRLVPIFTVFVFYHLCPASGSLVALSIIEKPASQSTPYGNEYTADKAIDGTTSTFSHTGGTDSLVDMHPWWRVDLGGEHCLGKIVVTLRTDCCGYRFTGGVARAGLGGEYYENQQCGSPATASQSYTGAVFVFACDPPVMARYVTLDIDHTRLGVNPNDAVLALAEVAVEEYSPPTECTVASTSSTEVTTEPVSTTVSTAVEQTSIESTVSTTVEQTSTNICELNDLCPHNKAVEFRRVRRQVKISNTYLAATKVATSPLRCATYCASHPGCTVFDFSHRYQHCHLHGHSSAIETTDDNDFFVFELVQ